MSHGKEVFSTSNAEEVAVVLDDPAQFLPGSSLNGLQVAKIARATYDFAVDGGAIGAIGLGVTIPDNAIIKSAVYDVITTLTSSGDTATIALHIQSADDVVIAVAIGTGTPWDAGLRAAIPDGGLVTNMFKTTVPREITATIAVEAVTAGKFHLYVEYVVSDEE